MVPDGVQVGLDVVDEPDGAFARGQRGGVGVDQDVRQTPFVTFSKDTVVLFTVTAAWSGKVLNPSQQSPRSICSLSVIWVTVSVARS